MVRAPVIGRRTSKKGRGRVLASLYRSLAAGQSYLTTSFKMLSSAACPPTGTRRPTTRTNKMVSVHLTSTTSFAEGPYARGPL
jgi:hypothetical protein